MAPVTVSRVTFRATAVGMHRPAGPLQGTAGPLQGTAGPVPGPALSLRRVGRTGSFYEWPGAGGSFFIARC